MENSTISNADFLSSMTETAGSVMDLVLDVGTDILSIPLVQIFLGISVLGIAISLMAKAVKKFKK